MNPSVTALLVSHDGERWLPSVLRQLTAQSTRPDRVVAVDTGSRDRSLELLRAGVSGQVLALDTTTAYPAAVRAGLESLPPAGPDEWVWLLHDDSAPAPDALEQLLSAAAADPEVTVLGPKIREWPSLRRLLEVGVTISGTGSRETGLERGEYDQGQHDDPHDVLAVNTAGMLVRRTVLERLGLDDELPVVHTDLDFGWRAARAGHRVRVVPSAVLFHAEASRSGIRAPGPRGERGPAVRRRRDREASLHTVLANCRPGALALVWLRLTFGTLLRAVGLLLVRAPRESWAELRALGATAGRPGRVLRSRRLRAAAGPATGPAARVRPLLAPWWTPYRHGLDELTGIGSAFVHEAAAVTGGRSADGPLVRRALRSPAVAVLLLLVVCAAVAARDLAGAGRLAGGALLPAPDSAVHWLRAYLSTTHDVGTGSTTAAPAYLLVLGLVGTLLLGAASLLVDLLVLGAVPLAALGAYRFLQRCSGAPRSSAWGAATYGVLLVVGGAVAQGRIGTLVAAALLPWLATSALGLVAEDRDRRTRAAWRATLWLAAAASFVPLLWWLAAGVLLLLLLLLMVQTMLGTVDRPRLRAALLVPVPAAAVLLLPWAAPAWAEQGWAALLLEAGLPGSALLGGTDALGVLGARSVEVGAGPWWTGAVVALLALLALLRGRTRRPVLVCWGVALLALAGLWVLTGLEVTSRSGSGTDLVWVGMLLVVVHGAWLTAAVVASVGLRGSLSGRSFGWRQPAGVLMVLTALSAPVVGAGWWVWHGSGDPVRRVATATAPIYMDDAAGRGAADGTLVLSGAEETGYDLALRRGHALALGEEAVLPGAEEQVALVADVRDLVTAPGPRTVGDLAASGIAFVFAPDPVDPRLAAALDAVPALAPASAADTGGRAWRLDVPTTLPRPSVGTAAALRPVWLVLQGAAIVVVAVLAAPTRKAER